MVCRPRRGIVVLVQLVLLVIGVPAVKGHEPGEARYLGNEGVLVRHGDAAIVFPKRMGRKKMCSPIK